MNIHIHKSLHIPIKISLEWSGIAKSEVGAIFKAVHVYYPTVLYQWFLNGGKRILPPGDIWQCLETLLSQRSKHLVGFQNVQNVKSSNVETH